MTLSKFTKNDQSFTCVVCKKEVNPLKYTSRDHCPFCLCSLHVDINPGDRQNTCKGIMFPSDIEKGKKDYVIRYQCSKCGQYHRNKVAEDDNFDTILTVMNHTYNKKFENIINNAKLNYKN